MLYLQIVSTAKSGVLVAKVTVAVTSPMQCVQVLCEECYHSGIHDQPQAVCTGVM